jgi:hypothetical protein
MLTGGKSQSHVIELSAVARDTRNKEIRELSVSIRSMGGEA